MAYTTIDDPSAYFHIQLYTGTGSELSVTNDANAGDFKPDWIWIKQRNAATNHGMFDSTRGVTKNLKPDTADAESTEAQSVKTFNTDGFTLGTSGDYNGSSDTHVAWQWIANGGTTSSNTDGSITSTVQANTTAGFSIVTYTGTGSAATIGHGLGNTPQVIITKDRDAFENWVVHHQSVGAEFILRMDQTDAKVDASSYNDTLPTSSVFSVSAGGAINQNTNKYVSYCLTEKQGYSKFGSYTGNGNADGPFVYTGFKPAWIMIKRTDAANSWYLVDSTRGSTNVISAELEANNNGAEATSNVRLDILSNGYKIRTSGAAYNASSGTYVYMAFAEHPFVGSDGVPTTAR
jgi:hypothetical protein